MTVPGFVVVRGDGVRAVVRANLAETLGRWLVAPRLERPADAVALPGGRGTTFRMTLADGRAVVVREYRRGGWIGRVVRATYLGPRPRPLRELRVACAARARGVPTVDVLGARVAGRLLYGGALVTAEVPDARPVLTALAAVTTSDGRRAIVAAAGRAVGTMHRLGLVHADLNCTNLVVAEVGGRPVVTVVDLDRARLVAGPVPRRLRRRTLKRLRRSLSKLDPDARLVPPALQAVFADRHRAEVEGACGS